MLYKNGFSPAVSTLFNGMTASGHLCGAPSKRSQEFTVLKYFSRLHLTKRGSSLPQPSQPLTGCGRTTIDPRGVTLKELHHRFTTLRRSPNREITVEISWGISVPRITGHLERKPCNWPHSLTFNFHVFSKSSLSL
jgi:hypothetical protein